MGILSSNLSCKNFLHLEFDIILSVRNLPRVLIGVKVKFLVL